MSVAVRDMVVKLAERIDPRDKDGVKLTNATIDDTDGEKFTKELRVDIYNQARFALFGALRTRYSIEELSRVAGSLYKSDATVDFVTGNMTKPTDYVDFISLVTDTGVRVIMLTSDLIQEVIAEENPHLTESDTIAFCFDQGVNIHTYNSLLQAMTDGTLTYFALETYVVADLASDTKKEEFDEKFHHIIFELGIAIANEMGEQEVNALAAQLLGQRESS